MTKNNGFISKPIAKIINIGVKVATVAVFELSSVKKIINKQKFNLVMHFAGLIRVDESIKYPKKYFATDLITENSFRQKLYLTIAKYFYFLIPTYLWLLKKSESE